jgi:hypothetical protein
MVGQHLANYRLNQAVIAPRTPINTPCPCNSEHHTLLVVLHLYRFLFSSRSVGEALSGVESRVESSLELRK